MSVEREERQEIPYQFMHDVVRYITERQEIPVANENDTVTVPTKMALEILRKLERATSRLEASRVSPRLIRDYERTIMKLTASINNESTVDLTTNNPFG